KPDENAVFNLPEISLTATNEVITYATRGMEPYRGFPQFMEAACAIQKRRPNCHIVIAGEDRICYGPKLPEGKTFKGLMLEKFDFDQSRLHFTGSLPYSQYLKLLQVSSAHIYLTYPFVLSWSMLEAMSSGALVLASNTPPVQEVIKDNFNGILFDFFSPAEIISKVDEVLDNKNKFEHLRINARKTIVENYDLKRMLQKQLNLIDDVIASKQRQ
ncbi:MAG: glycosyltransferase, partial [Candidatus Gastranaerophilaceae bacterium]